MFRPDSVAPGGVQGADEGPRASSYDEAHRDASRVKHL